MDLILNTSSKTVLGRMKKNIYPLVQDCATSTTVLTVVVTLLTDSCCQETSCPRIVQTCELTAGF